MISLRSEISKLDKLAGAAFKNAISLHFDSIILFRHRSYPTSHALSILAIEEFAKAHLFEDLCFHAAVERRKIDSETHKYLPKMLFSHRWKQRSFAYRVFEPWRHSNGKLQLNPFTKKVTMGQLERAKQDSLYVGLKSKRATLFPEGRIALPSRIRLSTARRNITIVNDYLVELASNSLADNWIVDADSIRAQLRRKFLTSLLKAWPLGSSSARNAVKLLSK